MPTMKDVAKLAGVSHGTVSNVINGVKTVNHDTVIRVEQAMKQLGYRPDAKARSLRQKKTNTIGVVLPNLVDNLYSRFYTGAEEKLRGTGYSLTLCLTDDCPENELAALRRLQQQRVEAIVLISCQPDQKEVFDDLAVTGIPVVFVQRKPRALSHPVFVGTDLSESIYRAASSLLPHTPGRLCLLTGNPAFSCEEDAVRGFQQALTEAQRLWQKADLRHADHNKESAFRAAMWWLQSAQRPAVIFTTCGEHAKGVLAAIEMFQDPASPKTMVVSVENESWIQRAVPSYIHKIPQDFLRLGTLAAQKAQELAEGTASAVGNTSLLPSPDPFSPRFSPSSAASMSHSPLRLALLEGAASYALQLMLPRFTGQTGVETETDILSYADMQQFARTPSLCRQYDLLQTNVLWFHPLAEAGVFLPLGDKLCGRETAFSAPLLQRYGLHNGTLYALPYMLDAQLLFYRKDLFEDIRWQRLFFEQTRQDLRLPQSWEEYTQVAAFFTRSLNPESPVPYGTTMGGCPFYAVYGFLPYLWEKGGTLFSPAGSSLSPDPKAIAALEQYGRTFACADPNALQWGWAEQTTQFAAGNAAMMILYQAHYRDYLSRETISTDGTIGVHALPDGHSVPGGWALVIPAESGSPLDAALLLRWLVSPENAIPYNVLGGSLPTEAALTSVELQKAFPWFSCAYESLPQKQSLLPENLPLSVPDFESILGDQLQRFLKKECSAQQALSAAMTLFRTHSLT